MLVWRCFVGMEYHMSFRTQTLPRKSTQWVGGLEFCGRVTFNITFTNKLGNRGSFIKLCSFSIHHYEARRTQSFRQYTWTCEFFLHILPEYLLHKNTTTEMPFFPLFVHSDACIMQKKKKRIIYYDHGKMMMSQNVDEMTEPDLGTRLGR